jgi:hypothetical protein
LISRHADLCAFVERELVALRVRRASAVEQRLDGGRELLLLSL